MPLTGTYKLMKKDLQKEAFDINVVKEDPIFFMGPNDKTYKKLDRDLFHKIQSELFEGAKLWNKMTGN